MTGESTDGKPDWDEDDTQDFIDYGRYFVPDHETQIETICDMVPPPSGLCHMLDLCCGAGLLARALLDRFPECHVHGFDGSPRMIARARAALVDYSERFEAQRFDLAAHTWRKLPWPVHATVSSLAIHHLDGPEKQALFNDMARILIPGGVFIIADLIQPMTQRGTNLAAKAWEEAVRQRSLALDGNLEAYEYFCAIKWSPYSYPEPVDKLSPLFDQLKWLEKAGFTDVDVFWMKAGHAIFGGRKPEE